jgi:hypothetical protein
VPLFDRSRFFDLPRHVARMLLELRDISSSLFWFLACQTWLTLWSFFITLISGEPGGARGSCPALKAQLQAELLGCRPLVQARFEEDGAPFVAAGWG